MHQKYLGAPFRAESETRAWSETRDVVHHSRLLTGMRNHICWFEPRYGQGASWNGPHHRLLQHCAPPPIPWVARWCVSSF